MRGEISVKIYAPVTAHEVADALGIVDCEDMTGEYIAGDMLSGVIMFTVTELNTIAAYKGISLDFLIHKDPAFEDYGYVLDLIDAKKSRKP